jgi:hypothetical protein
MEISQFENLCMLTIKNPSNTMTKGYLLCVLHSLSKSIGFAMPEIYWFETGKQNQQHIHSIVKKKLTKDNIPKMSKTFKTSKTTIVSICPDEYDEPVLIENKLNHNCLTFHISPITSKGHYQQVTEEYRYKEADYRCDFIEDKPPFTLSPSSLPFFQ